eukprot:scaffold3315_cov55-Cyclotella_meneghiniana.AAC.9
MADVNISKIDRRCQRICEQLGGRSLEMMIMGRALICKQTRNSRASSTVLRASSGSETELAATDGAGGRRS